MLLFCSGLCNTTASSLSPVVLWQSVPPSALCSRVLMLHAKQNLLCQMSLKCTQHTSPEWIFTSLKWFDWMHNTTALGHNEHIWPELLPLLVGFRVCHSTSVVKLGCIRCLSLFLLWCAICCVSVCVISRFDFIFYRREILFAKDKWVKCVHSKVIPIKWRTWRFMNEKKSSSLLVNRDHRESLSSLDTMSIFFPYFFRGNFAATVAPRQTRSCNSWRAVPGLTPGLQKHRAVQFSRVCRCWEHIS